MSSTNSADAVTAVLKKYDILHYREHFAETSQYAKKKMEKGLDHLIRPFSLSEDEKRIPAGLLDIALSSFDARIELFPKDYLSRLQIDPVKPDTRVQHIVHDSQPPPSIGRSGARKPLPSTTRSTDRKRRQPSMSSGSNIARNTILSDEENDEESLAAARKRFRPSRRRQTEQPAQTGTVVRPEILQPVLQKIFDGFWDLEMEPSIAIPFFSIITRENCERIQLPGFYEKVMQECTLRNIKERLENGMYSTPEAFERDFHTMFNNVTLYYSPDAPQHEKAVELKRMFEEKWNDAKAALITP
mmetsp:Transcript_16908/g.25489  ORF Transcript_16908/g.25489 Transcript_16908/m.25489 type:complete len:301 (-) Transcript_16908:62-964(-)